MAQNFTIDPLSGAPTSAGPGPTQVQAGVYGGANGLNLSAPQAGPVGGIDLNMLAQWGGKLIDPIVKLEEERAFMHGMAEASRGKAAADIAAERPEWATLWGDDAATKGARAFEQVKDSENLRTKVMTAMPELRKLPPEKFEAALFQQVQALKTGDPVRDQILLQSAVQFMPDAIRMHTRGNMAWQQEVAIKEYATAAESVLVGFEAYTSAIINDPTTRDAAADETAIGKLADLFTPIPGVEQDTQRAALVATVTAHTAKGNFSAMNALRATGLLLDLPVEQRTAMLKAEKAAAREYLPQRALDKHTVELARIHYSDGTVEEKLAAVDALNTAVAVHTGISVVPFATEADRERIINGTFQAQAAAAKAARTQEAKNDEFAGLQSQIAAALRLQGPNAAGEVLPAITGAGADAEIQAQGNRIFASIQDPGQRAAFLESVVGATGPVLTGAKGTLLVSLGAEALSPRGAMDLATVAALSPLVQGRLGISSEDAAKATMFMETVAGGVSAKDAWEITKVYKEAQDAQENTSKAFIADMDAQFERYQSTADERGSNLIFTDRVEQGEEGFRVAFHRAYKKAGHATPDARGAWAAGALREEGWRTLGKVGYLQDPKADEWHTRMGFGNPQYWGEAFEDTVNTTLESIGGLGKMMYVMRLPDEPAKSGEVGKARFYILGTSAKDETKRAGVTITEDMIRSTYKVQESKRRGTYTAPQPDPLGPDNLPGSLTP